MAAGAGMLASVLVGGAIAAQGCPALLAGTQVEPRVTRLDAFFALPASWLFDRLNRFDMNTRFGHGSLPLPKVSGFATIRQFRCPARRGEIAKWGYCMAESPSDTLRLIPGLSQLISPVPRGFN